MKKWGLLFFMLLFVEASLAVGDQLPRDVHEVLNDEGFDENKIVNCIGHDGLPQMLKVSKKKWHGVSEAVICADHDKSVFNDIRPRGVEQVFAGEGFVKDKYVDCIGHDGRPEMLIVPMNQWKGVSDAVICADHDIKVFSDADFESSLDQVELSEQPRSLVNYSMLNYILIDRLAADVFISFAREAYFTKAEIKANLQGIIKLLEIERDRERKRYPEDNINIAISEYIAALNSL